MCVSGCPKPESKTLTLTITEILFKIIPSFTFYIIISYIGSSHHSTQTTFFNPFLTHFWEVDQVPTTQSLTITEMKSKIIPSLKQINLVLCYIYTHNIQIICKMQNEMKCCVFQGVPNPQAKHSL